ncbi:DUF742 domain-containing protein [Streptomyces alkaliphilus]|uniref:DUF742 domain-containing protein n=1 Tax=Streptomyces alkaliphilus TaxID=1472722 RepID=A0A7W3Y3A8_9ACTN|nr:DUF742 domain-containing protein [Streptomyces alkaliphilus]MBB0246117.1 DUF742 domain-containing protein [Streptomyces alkaliphilus]MQS09180.1 DUF742 domain-containing protein [Streptomyces alkaliphilus]
MSPPSAHRRRGMVRPYAAAGGNLTPTRSTLDPATLLIADPKVPLTGLGAYPHRLMALCLPGVLSVAEAAVRLELPVAVTMPIASRLVDSGHLVARAPFVPAADRHDRAFLERILDGLRKL